MKTPWSIFNWLLMWTNLKKKKKYFYHSYKKKKYMLYINYNIEKDGYISENSKVDVKSWCVYISKSSKLYFLLFLKN